MWVSNPAASIFWKGGKMKLLIPAEILKAATVYTSKDKTRYNMNCLLFEDGKVIATNGYSLLVWRHGARARRRKS